MSDKTPKVISEYTQGIANRAKEKIEARKLAQPVFPNLAQASIDPSLRGAPRTLSQVAEEQTALAGGEAAPTARSAGLSDNTIAGLQELARAQQEAQAAAAPVESPAATVEALVEGADSAEVTELLELLREQKRNVDPIVNDMERKAVDARVKAIDISQGLLSGEFTQEVPIVPGALVVTYKSLNAIEQRELKLRVYRESVTPEAQQIAQETLGLYEVVASIVKINTTTYPKVTKTAAQGALVFDHETFETKLNQFMRFPLALLTSLGAHGAWFDARVRRCFSTADQLKNG